MITINPLDLPEIREALSPYLSTNDLARCIKVCKAWHSSFYPLLWTSVDIPVKKNKQPPSQDLRKHHAVVRRLVYHGQIPNTHLSINYPSLRTLHVYIRSDNDLTFNTIIKNHPSLAHLELRQQVVTWSAKWLFPDTLSNLSTLRLIGVTMRLTSQDAFWRICSQLDILDLQTMVIDPITTPPETTWKVKDLTIVSIRWMEPLEQLRLIGQCPELRRLHWSPGSVTFPVPMFLDSVLADTWPMLEDLCLDESRASDEQLSQIIKNMRRVTGFSVAKTSFNILSMSVLQYHFHCLRRVNTSYLIQMDDITSSELTIEILKSCPKLERLKARGLPAEYLMNNTPWACEITLRTLEVSLEIKPSPGGDAPQQEAIMTRLSKLVNLERLDMSNKWIWKPIQLSCGLKRLGTLTKLQELVLPIERQCLSLEDVEWMIAHWRNLKSIEGDVSWDDDDPESLIAKFSEAGIGAHKLSVSEM